MLTIPYTKALSYRLQQIFLNYWPWGWSGGLSISCSNQAATIVQPPLCCRLSLSWSLCCTVSWWWKFFKFSSSFSFSSFFLAGVWGHCFLKMVEILLLSVILMLFSMTVQCLLIVVTRREDFLDLPFFCSSFHGLYFQGCFFETVLRWWDLQLFDYWITCWNHYCCVGCYQAYCFKLRRS